jgi:hypothetical protein
MDPSTRDLKLLLEAHERAEALLKDLLRQQLDLERCAPTMPPTLFDEARGEMNQAIDSIRKMLQSILDAIGTYPQSEQEP